MGYRDPGHASDLFGGINEPTGGVEFRPKTPAERLDDQIRRAVSERLAQDARLASAGVEVFVKQAEVMLTGHVSSSELGARAEELARSVSGVTSVRTELMVSAEQR